MYASVRRYRIEPKNMDELVKRIPGAVDVISKLNGFKAYYVIRGGDGALATVSVFNDKAAAEQSNQTAAKWVRRMRLIFSPALPIPLRGRLSPINRAR